jgi:hypothetical protein
MPHSPSSIRLSRLSTPSGRPVSASVLTALALLVCLTAFVPHASAQKRRPRGGGARVAVVVDERLAALRDAPDFSANLLRRMSRGRIVSVLGAKRAPGGVTFYRVGVTRRTAGWLQSEAVVRPALAGEDERLLRLIRGSEDFDRVERAGIFLEMFPRSPLRPAVLLMLGEAAEGEAVKLSRAAGRRLDEREMAAGGAPAHTYFLNYSGLDRYRRQGVGFDFDPVSKQFRYDGAGWREILRRFPHSPEAAEARKRLDALADMQARSAQR